MQLLDFVKNYPGGVAMTMGEVALAKGYDNAPTVANPGPGGRRPRRHRRRHRRRDARRRRRDRSSRNVAGQRSPPR